MLAPWNEIRPKKYLSPGIPVVPLWQNSCNLSCAIPLGICNSKKRFAKSSTNAVFVELFYGYFCGEPRVYPPLEGNPVAPLGSADSLRELLDLVARHPGHKGIHPRLKPGFLRSG